MHHTTDVLFASSHVHFILHASTLAQEHLANFQMLALLYLFPLASVDLYVPDVKVATKTTTINHHQQPASNHCSHNPTNTTTPLITTPLTTTPIDDNLSHNSSHPLSILDV